MIYIHNALSGYVIRYRKIMYKIQVKFSIRIRIVRYECSECKSLIL